MKKTIFLSFSTFVCAAAFAAITSNDVHKFYNETVEKHKIDARKSDHIAVCADLQAWEKTVEFADDNARLAYLSNLIKSARYFDDRVLCKESLEKLVALPNKDAVANTLSFFAGQFNHLYANAADYKIYREITLANIDIFNMSQRFRNEAEIAKRGLRLYRDYEQAEKLTNDIFTQKPAADADDNAKNNFRTWQSNALKIIFAELIECDIGRGQAFLDRAKTIFNDKEYVECLRGVAAAYKGVSDRENFDKLFDKIKSLPPDLRDTVYWDFIWMLDTDTKRNAVNEALKQPGLTPSREYQLLEKLADTYFVREFNYGSNTPGEYANWRGLKRKQIKLYNDNQKDVARPQLAKLIGVTLWFDDLAFAEELLAMANENELAKMHVTCAQIASLKKDFPKAAAEMRSSLTAKSPVAETNLVNAVCAFLENKGLAEFNKAAAGLDAKARLELLRKTSALLYKFQRFEDCHTIFNEITANMYQAEPKRVHNATYVKNAPKSADGFVRTPFYNDWNAMFTGVYPYGDGYGQSPELDVSRHLIGVEQPKSDPAWRTGIRVLYDEEAVHIFIRCDDPEVQDVWLGKRSAGTLEIVFRAGGDDKPYYSLFFDDLPGSADHNDVDWASASAKYLLREDAFKKDACLTSEGAVAHIYVPWINFHHSLPLDGKAWTFGLQRWGKQSQTISGDVHELSRALQIVFPFNAQQVAELKRTVARTAFNRFVNICKDDADVVKTWNDPVLGDPEFYEKSVAPFLEKLNAAGEQLDSGNIDKLFAEFVPVWAEIRYAISDLRTRWLTEKRLSE